VGESIKEVHHPTYRPIEERTIRMFIRQDGENVQVAFEDQGVIHRATLIMSAVAEHLLRRLVSVDTEPSLIPQRRFPLLPEEVAGEDESPGVL
jgi:hypothetical protein